MIFRGLGSGVALVALLAGCGGSGHGTGGAILLSVQFAADVPQARIAETRDLEVTVDGAESFATDVPVDGQLATGSATVRYRPSVSAGSLRFSIVATDGNKTPVAVGQTVVAILPNAEAHGTVILDLVLPVADGGVRDLSLADHATTAPVDQAGIDLAGADLTMLPQPLDATVVPPPDQSLAPLDDLATDEDMAQPPMPDLAVTLDLARLPDLVTPPDLGASFNPAHVPAGYFGKGMGDLILYTAIDTGALTLDGAAPPIGVVFENFNGLAVLSVDSLTVPGGRTLRVTGSRPLVVVATDFINIAGTVDGSAHGNVPGAGGGAPGAGSGMGVAGSHNGGGNNNDSGGSGAGGSGVGGASGAIPNVCAGGGMASVAGGPIYGDATISALLGGSGGGSGSIGVNNNCNGGSDVGGAGGGAIQLTAENSIVVSGKITVGGGGGSGGCKVVNQLDSGSGAGGGSGGALLIEAPAIDLSNAVAAANGGGGGGAANTGAGGIGSDGQLSAAAAPGGIAGVDNNNQVTANFGGGAGGTNNAGGASNTLTVCGNAGGGGGAPGRIYLHSRGAAAVGGATLSPPAVTATNL